MPIPWRFVQIAAIAVLVTVGAEQESLESRVSELGEKVATHEAVMADLREAPEDVKQVISKYVGRVRTQRCSGDGHCEAVKLGEKLGENPEGTKDKGAPWTSPEIPIEIHQASVPQESETDLQLEDALQAPAKNRMGEGAGERFGGKNTDGDTPMTDILDNYSGWPCPSGTDPTDWISNIDVDTITRDGTAYPIRHFRPNSMPSGLSANNIQYGRVTDHRRRTPSNLMRLFVNGRRRSTPTEWHSVKGYQYVPSTFAAMQAHNNIAQEYRWGYFTLSKAHGWEDFEGGKKKHDLGNAMQKYLFWKLNDATAASCYAMATYKEIKLQGGDTHFFQGADSVQTVKEARLRVIKFSVCKDGTCATARANIDCWLKDGGDWKQCTNLASEAGRQALVGTVMSFA